MRTSRETAAAERDKTLALIRPSSTRRWTTPGCGARRARWSRWPRPRPRATLERAAAEKDELLARAEGTAALIQAENAQSPELIDLKLDLARIEALPAIVEKMMKPAEKIETIRINQITGLGGSSAGGGSTGGGDGGGGAEARGDGNAVNQVVDAVMRLALQLPAVRKLGEEVGINVGGGVRGLSAPLLGDHGEHREGARDRSEQHREGDGGTDSGKEN